MSKISNILIGALCVLLLSGCGFKLRGAYQLPVAMNVTYIDIDESKTTLARSLKRSLKSSNIKIVNRLTDNAASLKIISETKSKRIVSVDSKGRAREYTLTYFIDFSVNAKYKKFKIDKQTVRLDRDFVFDTEDVLGNSREESKLYEEMQQDLVRLIMFKLQSHK